MKLTVYKEGVVTVYLSGKGNKVVKARELYEKLEINEKFADWIKRKIKDHSFEEDKDYCCISEISETQTKAGRKGKSVKSEYVFKLHPAKKIALGTNNKAGDSVKDHFIKCEEIIESLRDRTLEVSDYTETEIQKGLTKQVNSVLYNNGGISDIIQHHQDNHKIHFGKKPSQHRQELIRSGLKVKSKSGRDIARMIKPEAACSMAMHDEFVAKGHTLSKLEDMKLKEKLEPAFRAILDLGFVPAQLLR